MHLQQQYHTAGYRGNQPGHDAHLRADSMQPAGSQAVSQYRGMHNRFEPTGIVQSYYQPQQQNEQNLNMHPHQPFQQSRRMGQSPQPQLHQSQGLQPFRPVGQAPVNPTAYQTVGDRGHLAGHDRLMRADSVQPSRTSSMAGPFRI